MHNAIEACMRKITYSIPEQILLKAFPVGPNMTLTDAILNEVIIPRVLEDCNLMGGRRKDIVLKSAWVEPSSTPAPFIWGNSMTFSLYRVPPEAREHQPITKVLGLRFPYALYDGLQAPWGGPGSVLSGTTMDALNSQILGSHTYSGVMELPTPILRSGNLVQLGPNNISQLQNVDWILECRLGYDEEFTNINEQAIMPLVDLVTCAVKSYIYNTLIIKTELAFLEGGQQLGEMKRICESYADQEDRYNDLMRAFNGASTILDPERRRARIMDAV